MASRSKSKSSNALALDDLFPLSQPSSDDGMAVAMAQKFQASMDKKKKEKEARYFVTYKKETSETNARAALEFNDYIDQIDQAFDDFLMAYAKSEDEIRSTWVKIIKAHAPSIAYAQEQLATEMQQEKEREDQQVLGIAYHKKSDEALDRIIADLLETNF